jgi:GPH family glycoside/pentoside/hexuronide:cation symporter
MRPFGKRQGGLATGHRNLAIEIPLRRRPGSRLTPAMKRLVRRRDFEGSPVPVSQSQSGPMGGQISLLRALVFASAAVPIGALGVAATVHLPRYFAAELGLSLALVGTVFALVRFIDIPIDTAMGLAMDRTKTRFGRYRVWMALGAPVLMLGFYMLLMTGSGDGPLYLGLWLLVMYLGYSGVLLSHLAWAGRLAPTYTERSRIFGAITGLGVIGAMAVLLIPIVMSQQGFSDAQGVQAMIWFIIASTALTCMLVVFSSQERIAQDGWPRSTCSTSRTAGGLTPPPPTCCC